MRMGSPRMTLRSTGPPPQLLHLHRMVTHSIHYFNNSPLHISVVTIITYHIFWSIIISHVCYFNTNSCEKAVYTCVPVSTAPVSCTFFHPLAGATYTPERLIYVFFFLLYYALFGWCIPENTLYENLDN